VRLSTGTRHIDGGGDDEHLVTTTRMMIMIMTFMMLAIDVFYTASSTHVNGI